MDSPYWFLLLAVRNIVLVLLWLLIGDGLVIWGSVGSGIWRWKSVRFGYNHNWVQSLRWVSLLYAPAYFLESYLFSRNYLLEQVKLNYLLLLALQWHFSLNLVCPLRNSLLLSPALCGLGWWKEVKSLWHNSLLVWFSGIHCPSLVFFWAKANVIRLTGLLLIKRWLVLLILRCYVLFAFFLLRGYLVLQCCILLY